MSMAREGKHTALRHILRDRKERTISPTISATPESRPNEHHPIRTNAIMDTAKVFRSVTFEENPYYPEDDEDVMSANDSLSSSYWALMQFSLGDNGPSADWNDPLSEGALQLLLDASMMTSPDQELGHEAAILNDETDPNVSWSDEDENERYSTGALKSLFPDDPIPTTITRNRSNDPSALDSSVRSSSPVNTDDIDEETDHMHSKTLLPHGSPFTTFRRNSTSIALDETQHYLLKIQSLEEQLQQAQQQVTELQQRNVLVEENGTSLPTVFRTPATHASSSSTGVRRSRSFSELSKLQTPSSASLTHHESLWERNKTLVTEIRFADQTCVELACQNKALQEQRDTWQKKYQAVEERNTTLQALVETTQSSLARAEATIENLRQKDQLVSGCDLSDSPSDDRATLEENETLRCKLSDMTTQMEAEKRTTAEAVRRFVHVLSQQMEHVHMMVTMKCSQYDAKLVSFMNAVQRLEEAILEYDDDDEDAVSDSAYISSFETGCAPEDEVDEDAATVKSGCVNATFSGLRHRKTNQSIYLARMEEARTSLPMDCVHGGDTESPMISPEKSHATTPTSSVLSRIAGLSDIEVSVLSGCTTETEGVSRNSKFLQHLQWISSSNPIQAFGLPHGGKHPAAILTQPESPDSSESTNEPVVSNFHRGFKQIATSNLSYSMSEYSPLTKQYPSTEPASIADQMHILQCEKLEMMEILDESLIHLSKLQDLASSQEYGIGIREESLQMEKLSIENELAAVEREFQQKQVDGETHDAAVEPFENMTLPQNKALQLDRDGLLQKLQDKVKEIEEAQDQIQYLQEETKKREALQIRYEALCLEKEEADALLKKKFIFPRQLIGESDALIDKLYGEIASFRQELAASTRKIEFLTSSFEVLQNEKAAEIGELGLSLRRAVEECDTLRLKVEPLQDELGFLRDEKESLLHLTSQQSSAITVHEETVGDLQCRLQETEEKAKELQTELQQLNDHHSATLRDLADMREQRDLMQEELSTLTSSCQLLKEEKTHFLLQLSENDALIAETERMKTQAESQITEYLEKFHEHQFELADCDAEIQSLKNELLRSNEMRERSVEENKKLCQINEDLYSKCARLKGYIRKLTLKCDEWEKYHDRESNVLQHLQQGYQWNLRKASELSMICQEKDQKVVHLMQAQRDLEDEMDDIARELEPLCEHFGNASLYVQ